MSGDPYRSGEPAPTRRRIEADEAIASCEAKLGPLSLVVVPKDLRARIVRLQAASADASDEVHAELAEALREALSFVEDRDHDLRNLPAEHAQGPSLYDSWGLIGTEAAAARSRQDVESAIGEFDRDAEVTLTGPRITARARVQGVPVLWSVHLGGEVAIGSSGELQAFSMSSHWMGTSVPRELPAVFIRGEGIADTVLKALHLRTEAQVDDKAFDATFFIEEGDSEYVRALLTSRLRKAFLARAHVGDFTFLLRDAEASVAWKVSLTESLVRADVCAASVELLGALREALGLLELLAVRQ